jgi:hypothetical protein
MPEWLRRVRDFVVALGAALVAALITSAVHAGLNTILAVGIGVCVAVFASIEVYAARKRRRSLSGPSSAQALSTDRPAMPAFPVNVRLRVDREMALDRFRLRVLNRGALGSFRAEVLNIRDQDGREPLVPQDGWPIPWLEDGSVASKVIPTTGQPPLDFAHFSLARLREDLEGTHWVNDDHWTFPTLPAPVKVSYSPVRSWAEQDRHYFIVTVRVIRDAPAGHADTQFKIGTEGMSPYCREFTPTLDPAPGSMLVPAEPGAQGGGLAVQVSAEPQWTSFGGGAYVVAFGAVITNMTSHDIDVRNMWVAGGRGDRQALSADVRDALDQRRDQMREEAGMGLLRPGTVRPGSPRVGLRVEEFLVASGEQPRCTFAVQDAEGCTYSAPVHWRGEAAEAGGQRARIAGAPAADPR